VIAAGEALLAPSVTRQLLDRYSRLLPAVAPRGDPTRGLTAREVAVLRLVAGGLSNAEIAESLHVAQSSVKTHVGHLLAKLGLADRVHLVIYAYESGLVLPTGRRVPDAASDGVAGGQARLRRLREE
jgi:DNA-binding NarL/FixJ family response regulator